jgi:hypothetical protein
MEFYDTPTVDKIVENLDHEDGRFSVLLAGVINSAPFQERRLTPNPLTPGIKPTTIKVSINHSSQSKQANETASQ